mmetsp:Transcript_35580/g.54388  ORF Transcript_35580/g.54388 Transcript_35580/m.54388 type:complete len:279 (+) Transcript_35580:2997-3833(+)
MLFNLEKGSESNKTDPMFGGGAGQESSATGAKIGDSEPSKMMSGQVPSMAQVDPPLSKHTSDNVLKVNEANDRGIKVPASQNIDGQIVKEANEENASEHKDKVSNLPPNKTNDEETGSLEDQPFNFQLEKYDSFMLDSDDTMGSQFKLKEKSQGKQPDVVASLYQGHKKRNQLLSKYVNRQPWDKFRPIDGASKELRFGKTEAIAPRSPDNDPPELEVPQNLDPFNGRVKPDEVKNDNIFLKTELQQGKYQHLKLTSLNNKRDIKFKSKPTIGETFNK